jgi:hypothetical protein
MVSAGRIKGLPGGQGLDIANRLMRAISSAHLTTGVIPIHDAYLSFDTQYSGIKKIHHLVLVCIVRKGTEDEPQLAEKFYASLEQNLLKEHGLEFDIANTVQMPTRHIGGYFVLENPQVDAIYRTYLLWRVENERPIGAKKVHDG